MDSTAAAVILKRQGHEVHGLHMKLHPDSDTWGKAQTAAAQIGIPIEEIDLTEDFQRLVVTPFVEAYAAGRTPSPCPVCNRVIKLTRLLEKANSLGCDKLATGHYARIEASVEGPMLLRGLDKRKDQSYFLFMLSRSMLDVVLFPLGSHTKTRVREWLRQEGFSAWEADESQELCFVPANDYRKFVASRGVEARSGPIKTLDGKTVGTHGGIVGFTVGQRRGLRIAAAAPLYVLRIDPDANAIYVGTKEQTYVNWMKMTGVNLLTELPISIGSRFEVKVRSTAKAVWCTVSRSRGSTLEVRFDEPQSGVALGQAGVLYSGDRVMAGGWIEETDGPTPEDSIPS
jgi:tRNA-specific 2-thiouridylase